MDFQQIILAFMCLFALALVFAIVRAFFKWVDHEKQAGKRIEEDYKNSDAYRKQRERFKERIDKHNKKN